MSKLTDRVSYLQGLAAGLKLDPEKDSHRILLEMLDILHDVGDELAALESAQEDLNDFVERLDEGLADLEEQLPPPPPPFKHWHEDEFDEDEDDELDETEVEITCVCPHCGAETVLDGSDFDLDEDTPCPHCGKPLFPDGISVEIVEDEDKAPQKDE